jgi:hypothetical protein
MGVDAVSAIQQSVTLGAIRNRLQVKLKEMERIVEFERRIRGELLSLKERYLEIADERRALWVRAKPVVREIRDLRDLENLALQKEKDETELKEMFESE